MRKRQDLAGRFVSAGNRKMTITKGVNRVLAAAAVLLCAGLAVAYADDHTGQPGKGARELSSSGSSGGVAAIASGEWFDDSTWDGGSVPSLADTVLITSNTVTTTMPLAIEVAGIDLGGTGKLHLWNSVATPRNATALAAGSPWTLSNAVLSVSGDLVVRDGAELVVSGVGAEYSVALSVGGDLAVSDSAAMAVYAGPVATNDAVRYAEGGAAVEIGGDLIVADSAWIYPFCHSTNGAPVRFSANNASIGAGAGIDATAGGFHFPYGPGRPAIPTKWVEGFGGSYGGRASINYYYSDYYPPTPAPDFRYGFAKAPYQGGSPGTWFNNSTKIPDGAHGGGAIILRIENKAIVKGSLLADGISMAQREPYGMPNGLASGMGSGGSIWITAHRIDIDEATAQLSARGGSGNYGGADPGGGGRICLIEGSPTPDQLSSLIRTGEARSLTVVYDDLADPGQTAWADNFSVAHGINGSSYYATGMAAISDPDRFATPGTAIMLNAAKQGTILLVD